ncbi:unnamed protein product [Ilex paraguariensis]|uniref:Uncharacterized protein n=1 Tax=Ilex paraguariensis TaxID=185542 RepID=A0ABC8SQC2_9AQUA
MAIQRKAEVFESVYSAIALVFVLVTCFELCDAVTVVDVYRLVQYDLSGVPFGSRLASLNHHAGSSLFASGTDLSRTVVILPVRELDMTFIRVGKHDILQWMQVIYSINPWEWVLPNAANFNERIMELINKHVDMVVTFR